MLSTAVIHSTSSLLAAASQTGTQCTFFDASLKHLAFLISDHLALKIAHLNATLEAVKGLTDCVDSKCDTLDWSAGFSQTSADS